MYIRDMYDTHTHIYICCTYEQHEVRVYVYAFVLLHICVYMVCIVQIHIHIYTFFTRPILTYNIINIEIKCARIFILNKFVAHTRLQVTSYSL